LLAREFVRGVAFVGGGPGIGRTSALFNIGAALARQGRQVLVLDQNEGRGSVCELLGLRPQGDLGDVLEQRRNLEEIVVTAPVGLRLVAGSGVRAAGAGYRQTDGERLMRHLRALTPRVEFLLIDARTGDPGLLPALSPASQEAVVVVAPHPEAVTHAYALIAQLANDFPRRRVHILTVRARSRGQAEALQENLTRTVRRFLALPVHGLGTIPEDDALRRANRLHLAVTEAFPGSPAALACALVAEAIDQWPYPGEDCLDKDVQRLVNGCRAALTRS
jgi:flagellar biosynthesis protein FlhG